MKNRTLSIHVLFSLIATGLWQSSAYAICKNKITKMDPTHEHITRKIDANLPLYQPITEWLSVNYIDLYERCSFTTPWEIGFIMGKNGIVPGQQYDGHTIFRVTTSSSTGFILDIKGAPNGEQEPQWKPVISTGGPAHIVLGSFPAGSTPASYKGALRMRFIKIDKMTDGTHPQWTGIDGFYAGNKTTDAPITLAFNATFRTTGGTCSVTFPNEVNLGDHNTKELPHEGSTTQDTPFNITLSNCTTASSKPSSISFQVNGTPDPNTTTPGVLQLNNPTDSKTAKGVGVQIIYKKPEGSTTPVTLNQTMPFRNLDIKETSATIDFNARYIRNSSQTIQPGRADASATFYIIYE